MSNVVKISNYMKRQPPAWGAQVAIFDRDGEVEADLNGFWGDDGLETHERCAKWAKALRLLSDKLQQTSRLTKP